MKDGAKHASKINFSEDEDSEKTDISNLKPSTVSKIRKMHSGYLSHQLHTLSVFLFYCKDNFDSYWIVHCLFGILFYFILFCLPDDLQDKQVDMEDENVTDREESDNEVKSISEERHVEDTEGNLDHVDESDEVDKMDSEENLADDAGTVPKDEKSDEDDKEAAESSKGSIEEATEGDKSDSEENQESNDGGTSPMNPQKSQNESSAPPDAGDDAENSDNEPLVITSQLFI